MALGAWFESTSTVYYYGSAAASGGVNIHNTDEDSENETYARNNSFDSGALLPEVIKLNLDAWSKENNAEGSDKRATFSVTVAGADSRSSTFANIKTYTFYKSVPGTSYGSALVKTLTFDNPYQFWYIKVSITVGGFFTTTEDGTVYGKIEMNSMTRTAYKTKTMIHGSGLQVMSGPDQYIRFGRNQNLINGDLGIIGSAGAGGTGYFSSNLTVGDDAANTAYPLYVVGDLAATGNIIAYVSSDERLKTHITPLEDSLEKLKKLSAVDFLWKDHSKGWGKKTPQDIGLIAQEVEKEFPSLVGEMADGYKGIRYDRMVPVLVDSIKIQDKKIEKLESLVEKLINELEEE